MDAKEFRLGNWVSYSDNDKMNPRQISGLNERFCHIVWGENLSLSTMKYWNDSYLQPIPLTAEWLEKFGFVINTQWGWVDINTGWFMIYEKDGYFKIHTVEGLYGNQFNQVHQLQNLYYALTQTELTIK